MNNGWVRLFVRFFDAIETDARISITHIGIYLALLQYRIRAGLINPIQDFSREIMDIAKSSPAIPCHKCIRDFSEYGYIRYEPSFNKKKEVKYISLMHVRQKVSYSFYL